MVVEEKPEASVQSTKPTSGGADGEAIKVQVEAQGKTVAVVWVLYDLMHLLVESL